MRSHLAYQGSIAAAQKGELRAVLGRYTPRAQDLDWAGVMESAEFVVGAYMGQTGQTDIAA